MSRQKMIAIRRWLVGAAAAVCAAWLFSAASCFKPDTSCEFELRSCGGAGEGGGGAGGGLPTSCVPSDASWQPAPTCGAFVSSSLGNDTDGTGAPDAPLATLGAAIAANATVIYACTDGFDEAVTLPAGVTLFGGLACTDGWTYVGDTTKTPLTSPADTVPLRLEGGGATTHVENFHVTARDAAAPGGSSIAVLANGATAEIVACEVTAGAGADGEAGASLTDDPGLDGANGAQGTDDGAKTCANSEINLPGAGDSKTCGGINVGGGAGGIGTFTGASTDGEPGNPTPGNGGPGGVAGAANCGLGAGQVGADGSLGLDGAGATSFGLLSASGYAGADGTPGATGDPGGGGGGGRGAACQAGSTGPSGGGGASGGCGGAGGGAGRGAGGSIALVIVNGAVTLTDVTLAAGDGGTGGPGGTGQNGGDGGFSGGIGGGTGACNGGPGGNGGKGGKGGGGAGGPSVGIATNGVTTIDSTGVTYLLGTPGPGGLGGEGDVTLSGAAGLGCERLDFAASTCT